MRTLIRALIVTLVSVAPALAANGSEVNGSSFLLILFLGFAALIILFQFFPGMVLFATMLKGLFAPMPKKAEETMHVKPGGK
jgi:hypothetical protein